MPVVGFGEFFDDGVAFAEEGEHVAAEEESFGEWAEDRNGSGDSEVILHLGCARGQSAEVVVGLHGAKDALRHGGLKISERLHGCVLTGEVLPGAEVFRAPGDLLRKLNEPGGDACDGEGLFTGVNVGQEMDFDAAGEVEATLDGCFDDGDLFELDHRVRGSSRVRVNVRDFEEWVNEDE